ncbi:metallophosphoesterase 1-like [Acropora palmata]|uniref:metallophosphoesterase 1-like n=1 Tax=Acropora palmata TaxID=6131 RepID=UPI003DA0642A
MVHNALSFKLRNMRMGNSPLFRQLKWMAILAVCLFLFCEWLIYYLVIFQCSWPDISFQDGKSQFQPLKTMFLTDTHLLGPRNGHWFDKLRREWQMERAFQTAISYFKPDVVFLLGDLFDEGMTSNDEEWDNYVQRFHKMFSHSEYTEFYVVVGNHDIGFHSEASGDLHLFQRFSSVFDSPSVKLLSIKGNLFVLVNSVAMQGDGCAMCSKAMVELDTVADKLDCHQKSYQQVYENTVMKKRNFCELPEDSPAPILIQHFPLYRETEMKCTGVDAPPPEAKPITNRESWDVVSKEMSDKLLELIKPRLVLSGHTHHGCHIVHQDGTPEMTIPSFSWRNRNNPSFVLGIITPDKYAVSKCFIPRESTVIALYIMAALSVLLANMRLVYIHLKSRGKRTKIMVDCCVR